jgi:NDP-4-keto-2,6-dideoxyhexose 3-C-methyltransferase
MTESKIHKINQCRVCGNNNLELVVDLGNQYLTGIFPHHRAEKEVTCGPLRLVKCHGGDHVCGLLQLQHSYDLGEMYGDNYGYRSGLNPSMVRHLQGKVAGILSQVSLESGDLVVDIGSNDGTTLAAYPETLNLVGIDPTGEKFRNHYKSHIQLIPNFFSADLLEQAYPGKKAKVITSFSMFYDLESPVDFAKQVAAVLDPQEGIWVFEQSYMPLMLERSAYDTICHEHLEFYALSQIVWIADKAGLKVVDVELNDINGGSFSVTAAHKGSRHTDVNGTVEHLLAKEISQALSTLAPYIAFSERIDESKKALQAFVKKARNDGKRIVGLGASTKGNVLLQYCGFTKDDVEVIADVNPDKFGALTPGTWIPIENEGQVLMSNPDYLLILPWHFRNFFVTNPLFKGRNLAFPLPRLEIVTPK